VEVEPRTRDFGDRRGTRGLGILSNLQPDEDQGPCYGDEADNLIGRSHS
jgi:hypothetical protein